MVNKPALVFPDPAFARFTSIFLEHCSPHFRLIGMRSSWLAVLAVCLFSFPPLWAVAQAVATSPSPGALKPALLATNPPALLFQPRIILTLTNRGAALPPAINFRPLEKSGKLHLAPAIKPGVYTTTPYSCLVVVPDSLLDERMVFTPKDVKPDMPILDAELRFVPFKAK
jgi:hypothetical protein